MSVKIKVIFDHVKRVRDAVKALEVKDLLVGIPEDKTKRDDDPIGNAAIGRIQEFGSPVNNIPPRPFLIPGAGDAQKEVIEILQRGAANALSKGHQEIDKSYTKAGLIAVRKIQERITSGEGFAPLKESTIQQRKRLGAKGEKPLIRTGQLRRSITFVIKGKNSG